MNTPNTLRYLTLGLALACFTAHAEQPLQVQWNDVCRVTNGNELSIKTADGADLHGFCVSVGVDEMSARTTDGKVVKLTRAALQKIHMHRARTGQLKALGKGMHHTLRDSVGLIFSPMAPFGLALLPTTIAWGAIATPFCALSDLHDKIQGTRELKLL